MKKKRPELRFSGFDNDWEQRKLGDEVSEIIAGGDVNRLKLVEKGKYPVIANAFTDNGIVGYYAEDYRIKAPAVTVTGRGDVGHAQARKVNFTPVVRLLSLTSRHDVDFLAEAINQNDIVLESTGVPQLTVPKLAEYRIYFPPTLDEEKKIGGYFCQLDHLITLHRCECKKLICIKKSMLENMFPQKGEKIPRIRFSGFTDDWEQRKLGEICNVSSGITGDSLLTDGRYKLTRIETIADGFIDEKRVGFTNQKPDDTFRLNSGDILYLSLIHISEPTRP